VIGALAERGAADRLDAVIYPKVDHPEEIEALFTFLDDAEAAVGLAPRSIRVGFLVESGWAAARLPEIALAAMPRLCSIIYGLADYSADLGLPQIADDAPLAQWVRGEIVNVAGAAGVPAIDGMTLAYPVADPALDAAANRARFLDRMALVHADAVRARDMGMLGKWVGHPAQLFAVLLAFDAGLDEAALDEEAAKLEAYRASVEEEARGATIIGGVMSDRATDRHIRVRLRRAVALGRFEPNRAHALGLLEESELAEAEAIWAVTGGRA
jgi:citrate lyase beta subunit